MPTQAEIDAYAAKHYAPSEASIEKAACDYARDLGCFVRKYKNPGNMGAPDRQFRHAKSGEFYIEFKKPGKRKGNAEKKLRAVQGETIKEMIEHGFVVFVCDDLEDAKYIIAQMVEHGFASSPCRVL